MSETVIKPARDFSEQNYNCSCDHPSQCNDHCFTMGPGEIKIEHTNDGSVIITQANLFRLYNDEVTITAGQFGIVLKALEEIMHEIREIESL